MSILKVDSIVNSAGTGAPAFPGGLSRPFGIQALAANTATLAGGYLACSDGREIATYDGVTFGGDLTVNLLTEVNALGVLSPAVNSTYYLYVVLAQTSAPVLTPTGRQVRTGQKGGAGALMLLATAPEAVPAGYVAVSLVRTDGTATYTTFETISYVQPIGSPGPAGQPYSVQTASFLAAPGDRVITDTTGGSFTATLPASPLLGDTVVLLGPGTFVANPLTIDPGVLPIDGAAGTLLMDSNVARMEFVFYGAGTGWISIIT